MDWHPVVERSWRGDVLLRSGQNIPTLPFRVQYFAQSEWENDENIAFWGIFFGQRRA
jgi:hypothetical protein